MKHVRYERGGRIRFGVLEGESITPLAGDSWSARGLSGEQIPLGQVRLLAPIEPVNIFCVGRNYAEHAKELGNVLPEEPLIFLKATNSLLEPEGRIRIPRWAGRVDYEGEMAVVIGKSCRNVSEKDAMDAVFGLTCLNDVTARDLQKKDGQLTRSKSFDTFCPMGPWIVETRETGGRRIETRLNGKVVQSANTDMMVFPVSRLIAHISRFATLRPGDVIATGTPAGVGPLKAGDRVEVEIEGIGVLGNHCLAEPF